MTGPPGHLYSALADIAVLGAALVASRLGLAWRPRVPEPSGPPEPVPFAGA